jgi:hypothetical protein
MVAEEKLHANISTQRLDDQFRSTYLMIRPIGVEI